MVDQLGDFQVPNSYPSPILATFSNNSGIPKDMGVETILVL